MDTLLAKLELINSTHLAFVIAIISLLFVFRSIISPSNRIVQYFKGRVNKRVFSQIQKMGHKINIAGEEKVITILFLDIKGFSSISENMPNRKVVEMLNRYFTMITEVIVKHNGTVDKYIGDAVMAFWGAPLLDKYQAKNALYAANEIKEKFVNEEVGIRIGINTGPALVGCVGDYDMLSYTAIGDSVNLASRLESLNKQYGTNIMFSKSTKDKLTKELNRDGNGIFWREIDKVRVYGKREVTEVYELVGLKSNLDARLKDGYEYFNYALETYRKGRWDAAENLFRKASRRLGSDSVSKTFIERCREFMTTPPDERWNGIVTLGK